jgi:hypothetical protein
MSILPRHGGPVQDGKTKETTKEKGPTDESSQSARTQIDRQGWRSLEQRKSQGQKQGWRPDLVQFPVRPKVDQPAEIGPCNANSIDWLGGDEQSVSTISSLTCSNSVVRVRNESKALVGNSSAGTSPCGNPR